MQFLLKYNKPTFQNNNEKKFDQYDFNWKSIYRIPCIATLKQKFVFSSVSSLIYYILIKSYFILA